MFNTLIQKRANLNMHLNIPASHAEQEQVIGAGDIRLFTPTLLMQPLSSESKAIEPLPVLSANLTRWSLQQRPTVLLIV